MSHKRQRQAKKKKRTDIERDRARLDTYLDSLTPGDHPSQAVDLQFLGSLPREAFDSDFYDDFLPGEKPVMPMSDEELRDTIQQFRVRLLEQRRQQLASRGPFERTTQDSPPREEEATTREYCYDIGQNQWIPANTGSDLEERAMQASDFYALCERELTGECFHSEAFGSDIPLTTPAEDGVLYASPSEILVTCQKKTGVILSEEIQRVGMWALLILQPQQHLARERLVLILQRLPGLEERWYPCRRTYFQGHHNSKLVFALNEGGAAPFDPRDQ